MLDVLYIGDRLRDIRKRALLAQQELAEKSGVGVTTIIRIEDDQVEPQGRTNRSGGPIMPSTDGPTSGVERLALYLRVSSEEQREFLRSYCQLHELATEPVDTPSPSGRLIFQGLGRL